MKSENFPEQNNKKNVIITTLTSYRPETILTNEEIEQDFYDKAKEEITETLDKGQSKDKYKHYGTYLESLKRKGGEDPIFEKVGIKSRTSVGDKERTSDMVIKVGKELLEKIDLNPKEKIAFITGTLSAEYNWPSVSAIAMRGLELTPEKGYSRMTGYDINAACSGWTLAIADAKAKLIGDGFMSALVFSSDTMTKMVDKYDKSRILFGDGATGALLEIEKPESTGFRILGTDSKTDAQKLEDVYYANKLAIGIEDENIRNRMNLNGEEVYKAGIEHSVTFIKEYLERNSFSLEDFDYVIPHQANGAMLTGIDKQLNLGENKYGKKKLLSNIEYTGNTAASSVPLCLFDHKESGHFKNGDRILMCSFAAGFTLGIVDVEYKE